MQRRSLRHERTRRVWIVTVFEASKEVTMSQTFLDRLPRQAGLFVFSLVTLIAVGCLGCVPAEYGGAYSEQYGGGGGVSVGIGVTAGETDADYLAQYGVWVNVPSFGMCWQPEVAAGWQPFFYGHWAWSDEGWAWVSYEPFGWLVYHYGYWDYQPPYGWFWVPGNTWSPARVEWYDWGDYCAWAPLPPPGVVWPDPWIRYRTDVWCVVNFDNFLDDNIGGHLFHGRIERPIYGGREVFERRAPDFNFIQQRTHRTIAPIRIAREPVNLRREVISPEQRGAFSRTTRGPRGTERTPMKNQPFQRMVLPPSEEQRVQQYRPQVERNVLIPRPQGGQERQAAPPAEQRREAQPPERKVTPPPEKRTEQPSQPQRQQRGAEPRRGRG
jgi:hypothetical protein